MFGLACNSSTNLSPKRAANVTHESSIDYDWQISNREFYAAIISQWPNWKCFPQKEETKQKCAEIPFL